MSTNFTLPNDILALMHKFEAADYEIYIVGGVVRDLILDRKTYDWDFTTNATPDQILSLFVDSFYDNKFGTVGIKNESDRPYEVTTYRTESGYSDNRRPDIVEWGKTLEEDLSRRDFTINAMALDIQGKLIDPFNGQDDIKNKLIRTVGKAEQRFSEDALRMMRAVRIASQLGFSIEENTLTAISNKAKLINNISAERTRDELLKLMRSDFAADGYLLLKNSGLGQEILPEMDQAFGVEQKTVGRHHIYDVGTHSVEALRNCSSKDPITRLATLIHDVGKVKTQKVRNGQIIFYNHEMESAKIAVRIADRLRFSNQQKDKFVRLVRWHQFTVDEHQTDSALRRFIKNVGIENLQDMLDLRVADRLGGGAKATSWRLEEYKQRLIEVQQQPFSIPDLKISGLDVMKIKNVPSGPMVGKYLQALFDEVVEKGLSNDREALISRLKELTI